MAKVEDDGELIPYAQKHKLRDRAPQASRSNRLAELWPEPDWMELAEQRRYESATLAALAATYWSLGTGPIERSVFDVKAHEWPELYDAAIAIVRRVFEDATNESLSQLRDRAMQLAGIYRNSTVRDRMRLAAAGRFGGRQLQYPFTLLPKVGWLFQSMVELGWPASDACVKTGVGVIAEPTKAASPLWMVITASPKPVALKEHRRLPRDQALQVARDLIASKLEAKVNGSNLRKAVTTRAKANLNFRIGPDYLQGRAISTQELMQTFRLRGIQFGEALSDRERQRWVNEAYVALMDLARVIDLKPGWVGLGGRGKPSLALAIGARGQGGAMAHFECHLRVINLTRDRGAGSLAHEWAHALDQHLVQSTFSDGVAFQNDAAMLSTDAEWINAARLTRTKIWSSYMQLADAVLRGDNNPFLEQARGIEALKGARKRYWTSAPELFARSFEAYVQDCLENEGQCSPWLVHGTLPADQTQLRLSAYPLQPQRQAITRQWARFMLALGGKQEQVIDLEGRCPSEMWTRHDA